MKCARAFTSILAQIMYAGTLSIALATPVAKAAVGDPPKCWLQLGDTGWHARGAGFPPGSDPHANLEVFALSRTTGRYWYFGHWQTPPSVVTPTPTRSGCIGGRCILLLGGEFDFQLGELPADFFDVWVSDVNGVGYYCGLLDGVPR
jgi:hypothetical protein